MESTSLPNVVENFNRHVIINRKQGIKISQIHVKVKEKITAWGELKNLDCIPNVFAAFVQSGQVCSALYIYCFFI